MHLFVQLLITFFALAILFFVAVLFDIHSGLKSKRPFIAERNPVTGLNYFRYYTNGHALFEEMKQSISSANSHIHLCFFIFIADDVGAEWLGLLKRKAAEGVEVRLLVDALSSFALRKKRAELAKAGVQIAFSGKPTFPFTFYYLNRRNHRKMMIIDGSIGYFGGFNVSRDYVGRNSKMGPWHDNHLKIEGESVHELQRLFLEDWKKATHTDLLKNNTFFPPVAKGPSPLTLIGTDGKQLEAYFAEKLSRAQTSIVIGSPYFVPSKRLMDVLVDRVEHGVKLSILLPMKKDHGLVQPASYQYLEPLLKKGAELFHFYQGFYHSKIFIIDRKSSYLGTANFDQRSLFWNDELSGFTEDPQLIHQALEQLEKEIRNKSVSISYDQLNRRSPWAKLKTKMSAWFSYFL